MAAIHHNAVIEMEAAVLSAEIIAFLMQPGTSGDHFEKYIGLLLNYFHGKGGDTPTQGDLKEAGRILNAYNDWQARKSAGKRIKKNSILIPIQSVYARVCDLILTGNPDKDWREIRSTLEQGECSRLKGVAQDARNLRLLERGTLLRQQLVQDWLDNGGVYANALAITKQAFVQEHFSTNAKPEAGVV